MPFPPRLIRQLTLTGGLLAGAALAAVPQPAQACIYWFPDFFSPLPGCNARDTGQAKGFLIGVGATATKAVAFVKRTQEVKREVEAWSDAFEQAKAFRSRLERFIGAEGEQVDPLASIAAEFNRKSNHLALRYWVVDGKLSQDSIEGLVDRARTRVRNPASFDSLFGRRAAERTFSGDQDAERRTVTTAASAHFRRHALVDSTADSLAAYGRRLTAAVADDESIKGAAYADLTTLGARLNRVSSTRLSTNTEAARLRLEATRTLNEARREVRRARSPGAQWGTIRP